MSNLKRPYELSIWNDVWDPTDKKFVEQKVCVIGSDKMQSQNRALKVKLVRNVNGEKKLSFEMYSQYIDNITGEKTHNLFVDELISERKVKLYYEDKWYDFIVKDITQNSSTHLNTYSLQDAIVQELAKNGFGVVLDADLMNNIGDAKELGEFVMKETDWSVSQDISVQKVEEALVHVVLPSKHNFVIKHLIDQTNQSVGVTEESLTGENPLGGKEILAFYSCCKNKPHRFQFIYKEGGYGKNEDGTYKINRDDKRLITEANCQYYIDFDNPEQDYQEIESSYDLYLPKANIKENGKEVSYSCSTPSEDSLGGDTILSTWYRGNRYGFSQQAIYVPLLDRYCQKYKAHRSLSFNKETLKNSLEVDYESGDFTGTKTTDYTGLYINTPYTKGTKYNLEYDLTINSGVLQNIGGHKQSFATVFDVYDEDGTKIGTTTEDTYAFNPSLTSGTIKVKAEYTYTPDPEDNNPYIWIQPNRGINDATGLNFTISNLKLTYVEDILGYVDSKFISPTLVKNYINNSTFTSNAGWTAASSEGTKPEIEATSGRFVVSDEDTTFREILTDLSQGTYDPDNIDKYNSYLKMSFSSGSQFILNSGIRDNRTLIENMVKDEEWVLDYKIVNASNVDVSSTFSFDLGDYSYNTSNSIHEKNTNAISFTSDSATEIKDKDDKNLYWRKIFTVASSDYTKETFKKRAKVCLSIKPTVAPSSNTTYYIEHISLYKKSLDVNGQIIAPDYEEQNSQSVDAFIDSGIIEKKYCYFPSWLVDKDNNQIVTNKDALAIDERKTLNYTTYKPVYNEGAKKIRSVSVKESNYFNILQSIAETFEQWLVLEIIREKDKNNNETGAIQSKKISFRNYSGDNNYACFKYGVNLKDIQRTFSSKNIVTKLFVKQNSNELAKDGFCTIQRAGANPTGESYIYDFQYYQNQGLMNAESYLASNYSLESAQGPDASLWSSGVLENPEYTINGYFPRIKKINEAIIPLSEEISGLQADLLERKAELELAISTYEASVTGLEETGNDFQSLTGVHPTLISNNWEIATAALSNFNPANESSTGPEGASASASVADDKKGVSITLTRTGESLPEKTYYFDISLTLNVGSGDSSSTIQKTIRESVVFASGATTTTKEVPAALVDLENSDVKKYLTKYKTFLDKLKSSEDEKEVLQPIISTKESAIKEKEKLIQTYLEYKAQLNKMFFNRYSRFIQEGTWISEEYVDDDKYYADAQSVLYNSCYPQVSYNINVLALSALPGYENLYFNLGDKTWVIDEEFFGEGNREEVVVTEIAEQLDDPSKDVIKVQNFKNQFQDLFQKITATVQQTKYNVGSYEKGAALMNAGVEKQNEFVTNALNNAETILSSGRAQDWTLDSSGLTIKEKQIPTNQIRIAGGGILLGQWDADKGEQAWKVGMTCDGISADLITAGKVNTGEIQIMNGSEPMFRWDARGISAYDANFDSSSGVSVLSNVDTKKFVRFDKHGIYGINHSGEIDGASWKPSNETEITNNATFALTWDGLKVKNDSGTTLRLGDGAKIGNNDDDLLLVTNSANQKVFAISEDGSLSWGTGSSPTRALYKATLSSSSDKPADNTNWSEQPLTSDDEWHRQFSNKDWYVSYTYDGGLTWSEAIQIRSANSDEIKEWYYATSNSNETPLGPNDINFESAIKGETDVNKNTWKKRWKNSPTAAGHGAVNKYLWNYEETILTNNSRIYTDPALITTQPKAIQKIYEFYIVTTGSIPTKPTFTDWNGTTLSYTNPAEFEWECVDTTTTTAASAKTAAQSEYLWNFEVLCYDDNTYSVSSTANIGTGGKGISSITNYYQATSTEAGKPTTLDGGASGSSWKTTISGAGQGATNPFLWTYEKTTYSNGVSENTAVSLLSRSPRTIKSITEYYKTVDNSATDPTTGITLGENNNSISNYNDWSTALSSPSEGESLWNVELIEFATKDDEGKNLYQVTAPARVGYIGVDSYTLSLDNDMDTIVQMSNGNWISGEVTVTAVGYKGHTQKTGLNSGNLGEISLTAPNGWTENTHYTFTNNTLKLNPTGEADPKGLPEGFTEGEFVFQWKNGEDVYAEKTFSLKKITSLADYDLVIPQVVYNSSQSDGTITINVLKKTQNGTQTLTSASTDTSIKLYQKSGEKYKLSDWSVSYDQYREDEIYFVLTSADGELGTADDNGYAAFKTEKTPSIIWDEETVEFTQNGAGLKKIDTPVRDFPYSTPNDSGYAWTTPKSGSETAFTDIGHTEEWTTGSTYDNSHILVGDTAYLVGTVSDKYSGTGIKQNITLYGTVTAVTDDGVTMTTTSVVWGGTKGDPGDAARHIELSNDNDVIAVANGNPIGLPITVTAHAYEGVAEVTTGAWSISSPSSFWTNTGDSPNYSVSGGTLTINSLPSGFTKGDFTFTWTPTEGSSITKKFGLVTVVSDSDWNLIIDKLVINTDGAATDKTINIQVQKTTSSGKVTYNLNTIPSNSAGNDEVYVVNSASDTYSDRLTTSSQTLSGAITYYLKQTAADGQIAADFQWDVEAVGAVSNGISGTSPYTISLNEDFESIPCDNDGNPISEINKTIDVKVFEGKTELNDWMAKKPTDESTGFYLELAASGINAQWSGQDISFTGFSTGQEKGTFTLTLRHTDNASVVYARTTFEAIKQKAGADGAYVYAVCDYQEIKKGSFPDQLTVNLYKRIGTGEPQALSGTVYYQDCVDDAGSFTGRGAIALSSGAFTIPQQVVGEQTTTNYYVDATSQYRIAIYSDESCTTLIDRLTIAVLSDGTSTYILYHNKGDTEPAAPTETDYNNFSDAYSSSSSADQGGWYKVQTSDSVYMIMKSATLDNQENVSWGPVTRVSGVLTNYSDLWNALDEESKKDDGANGIYTLDGGKIGINADLIKTGALCVGPLPPAYDGNNWGNNVLYAAIDDGEDAIIGLAGWTVTKDRLTTGTIGNENSFGVYPKGITSGLNNFAGSLSVDNDAWVITAGTNFGVTKKGNLFAQDINFGNEPKNCIDTTPELVHNGVAKIGGFYLPVSGLPDSFGKEYCLGLQNHYESSGDRWNRKSSGENNSEFYYKRSNYDSSAKIFNWPIAIATDDWKNRGYGGINEEAYYRFMQTSNPSLYNLQKGHTYHFSGKIALQQVEWLELLNNNGLDNFDYIGVRYGFYIDGSWQDTIIPILKEHTESLTNTIIQDNPNFSNFKDFSVQFTIPEEAIGCYFSVQMYRKDSGKPYSGWAQLKDLSLVDTRSYGQLSPDYGLRFWSGSKGDNNLLFKLDNSGAYIKGEIVSSNATITGGSITIKDSQNREIFSVGSSGLTMNGSGTFSGNISASNISGGTISGATITGGSLKVSASGGQNIYINNGKIIVGSTTIEQGSIESLTVGANFAGDWALLDGNIWLGGPNQNDGAGFTATKQSDDIDLIAGLGVNKGFTARTGWVIINREPVLNLLFVKGVLMDIVVGELTDKYHYGVQYEA